MWSVGRLIFDLSALVTIILLSLFDLLVRYIVFRRLESAAIDVALFSLAYSLVQIIQISFGPEDQNLQLQPWVQRGVAGGVCLGILVVIHLILGERLKEQTDDVLDQRIPTGAVRAAAFVGARPLIQRSILLTFTGPELPPVIRVGKRNWRAEVAAFVNRVGPNSASQPLTELDFLLPGRIRLVALATFGLVSIISIVIPTLSVR